MVTMCWKTQEKLEQTNQDLRKFIESKYEELDLRIVVSNEKRAEAIQGEWHANVPENLLTDPKSLSTFIQDEVFLQFSHHFRNLQDG